MYPDGICAKNTSRLHHVCELEANDSSCMSLYCTFSQIQYPATVTVTTTLIQVLVVMKLEQ
jgi:hypothetical protein